MLEIGADLLDGTELKGIAETVKTSSQSISGVDSRVEALDAKVAAVLEIGAHLLEGTELKGIAETVKTSSQSISGVDSRVEALDAKVTDLISIVGALQTAMGQDMDSLNEKIESVHADVKTPIIVKRLF